MNKIIPFNKEIKFNESIGEITSILIDDNLKFIDSYTINGDLIVKGSHQIGDIEEDFSFSIPTMVTIDDKYDTSKAKIIIDDFYYEIINDDTLKIKVDLILDNLLFKEKEIEPINSEVDYDEIEIPEEPKLDDETKEELETPAIETPIDKEYSIYRVYVVVDGDTLSSILEKYKITSEELSYYNDINNIKPGVKLIIPSVDE